MTSIGIHDLSVATAHYVVDLTELAEARYPVYAEADLVVQSVDVPHEAMVDAVVAALEAWLVKDAGPEREAP